MAELGRILSRNLNARARIAIGATCAALVFASVGHAFADGLISTSWFRLDGPGYNWTGFYAGGNAGIAWGTSNWNAGPGISGSTSLFQTIDTFSEAGSVLFGMQAGYNYVLPNRILLGAEVDVSAPSFPALPVGANPFGLSVGGISAFSLPTLGAVNLAETVLTSGTVRGRIGYAPGNWLFYATGGFAWTFNQQSLTQLSTGNTDTPYLWRLGWAAGAGVEVPVAPHWTARFEYLYTGYGNHNTPFFAGAQPISSDFSVQELRAGLDYMFDNGAAAWTAPLVFKGPTAPAQDNLSFHGQTTFVWQGYPAFRSPYQGLQSLPGGGEGRETFDTTLFVGIRPWQNAEIWLDPEIDQGHGLDDTRGVAGFTNGEAYKLGFTDPYARANRYFIRQTIDLGGETEKVEDGADQFAMTQTANRLVLTAGKFFILDVFDTNKYANNAKTDFLNWSVINNGAFDFASDAWSTTYGASAEWYQGIFTLRGGIFDTSASPADALSPTGYELDSTFHQFELIGEIESRYALWGQPGKIKVAGWLIRGNMGTFEDAINLAAQPGGGYFGDVTDALVALRHYQSRPGAYLNLEQQVTETVGLFARASWADGNVEPWDNTDIDESVAAGLSFNGKPWGRPDDTIGVAGVVNGLAPAHIAYFNDGGMGIVIGDGQLPHYATEDIFEAYYSYAITSATKVSFDYQFIANPAYNTDRGPVNVFAGRFHTEF